MELVRVYSHLSVCLNSVFFSITHMSNNYQRPVGAERRNEVGKGLLGASIGFAVLGPVGAALGGFIGARIGCAEDDARVNGWDK